MWLDKNQIPFEIVYSDRRKTVAIQIKQGQIRVLAPKSFSNRALHALLEKRRGWIERKVKEHAERPETPVRSYVEGETFLFRGDLHTLKIIPCQSEAQARSSSQRVSHDKGMLYALCPEFQTDERRSFFMKWGLWQWYQGQAELYFREKTKLYAGRIGVSVQSIEIKEYKARWGACSCRGEITYNWRLIMAPDFVIDYVIVHELCHILEHNHSKAFWFHVAQHFPAYLEAKQWLKKNGGSLVL